MKALIYDKYGKALEVLKLEDITETEPGDGQVKIKMLYSPINPSDLFNTIEGTYSQAMGNCIWNYGKSPENISINPSGSRIIPKIPNSPGLEGVGIVVKAGKGLKGKLFLGKRVAVVGADTGNWRPYNVVGVDKIFPLDKKISDQQAAVGFVNPLTAYIMVKEVLKVKPGAYLMQSAGNSELGKMVVRLGKHYGFKTICIVRDANQKENLLKLGAAEVIDITTENLKERIHQITQGMGVKYALDAIGGHLGSVMMECLTLKSHMILYGTLSNEPMQFSSRVLLSPNNTLEGFFLTNWMEGKPLLKKLFILKSVGRLIKKGVLSSEIDQCFPLTDYKEAIHHVLKPGNKGKVLFSLNINTTT